MLPFAHANPLPPRVYTIWDTMQEAKNIETPIGPKPEKTPVEGKMIIPSMQRSARDDGDNGNNTHKKRRLGCSADNLAIQQE